MILVILVLPALLFGQKAVFAASSFGTDYRHLSSSSPGTTPDTTTTITISSGTTGAFRVDPFTSGSSATGTPSSSSPTGYGWRTAEIVGSSIPAGTWSFTITTKASLLGGSAVARLYAYSADTLGGNIASIGSAAGSVNVLGSVLDQQHTLTFTTASATDMTNKVLVLEYWIDVTAAPILATTVTFNAGSSSQSAVLPSSSGTFYLAKAALFSIGESETVIVTEESSSPSHYSRVVLQSSGLEVIDSLANSAGYLRLLIESSSAIPSDAVSRTGIFERHLLELSGAITTDIVSRLAVFSKQVSEGTDAIVSDSTSRLTNATRDLDETSGVTITDTVTRLSFFARLVAENAAALTDFLTTIITPTSPPSNDNGNSGGSGNTGRTSGRPRDPIDHPLDRVIVMNISFVDERGTAVPFFQANRSIEAIVELKNQQLVEQKYTVIFEMVDEENIVTNIISASGTLRAQETVNISREWQLGWGANYNVLVMVWDTLERFPDPLSEKHVKMIIVI